MSETPRDSGFGIRDSVSPTDSEQTSSLDRAIDVVAREMTALDAHSGMRAEVLARIEGEGARAAAGLRRWAWAGAAATVVVAVAAAVWLVGPQPSRSGQEVKTSPVTGSARAEAPSTPTRATGAGSSTNVQGHGASVSIDRRRVAGVTVGSGPAGDTTGAVEQAGPSPLAQLDPIAIAALGPDAIHIPDIGIEPLRDLKPITIQDIPVGSGEPQRRDER